VAGRGFTVKPNIDVGYFSNCTVIIFRNRLPQSALVVLVSGEGSVERLFGLQIPTAFLDKVFIGHLHGDHFGGIGSVFVAGGIAGRFSPLRIWGPSGSSPELGTKAAIEAMVKMYAWDIAGRLGQTDISRVHHRCYRIRL
jgi:ribonuclease BN (tRNA processing enzyme)